MGTWSVCESYLRAIESNIQAAWIAKQASDTTTATNELNSAITNIAGAKAEMTSWLTNFDSAQAITDGLDDLVDALLAGVGGSTASYKALQLPVTDRLLTLRSMCDRSRT